MKINRMASEKEVPDWAFGLDSNNDVQKDFIENVYINKNDIGRIANCNFDENRIVTERNIIENRIASGSPYYYNQDWNESVKSDLKEYALACNMDMSKFKPIASRKVEASSESIIRTAQSNSNEQNALVLDPFHLDVEERNVKSDWEKISGEQRLGDKPSMMFGAIKGVRGGEDYSINSDINPAANQNSITNPNAIEQLAESEKEDTGVRLARERDERELAKEAKNRDWEQEKIASMKHLDIIPKGNVFPTEVMNAQPGLNTPSSQMGVYAKFDVDSIPEKTQGEKIAEANETRRKSIQGEIRLRVVFK
ncbi:hypothetical protein D4R86_03950 [bacterium]|nr:MAG: hypothetical protein D4R86_03950 [bacterium]